MTPETLEEKRKRLLAAMTRDQAPGDDPRMAMLNDLMARMDGGDGPLHDPTGQWQPHEMRPGAAGSADDDAAGDEAAQTAAEEAPAPEAETAHDTAPGDAESDDARQTHGDDTHGDDTHGNDSRGRTGAEEPPYMALLRLLFPNLNAAEGEDPLAAFARMFPGMQGMPDMQSWIQPRMFEQLFEAVPGMSQWVNFLKNGPAQDVPRDKEARHSPLVAIRTSGDRTPFFCVHAILGSTFHYHRLAALMDPRRPFYALQAQGLDPREEPLDDLEQFADRYLLEVRKKQPHGPYKLGGYSFGSWVAFEMARKLIAAGETVDLLVLIGAGLPVSMSAPALCANSGFAQKYLHDFRKMLVEPFLSYEERMNGGLDGLLDRFLTPLQRLYRAHCQAIISYVPTTYPGRFVLLETIEQRAFDAAVALGGWDRLAMGGVESVLVSGNHLSMLEEPHIHEVAAHLDRFLDNPPGR